MSTILHKKYFHNKNESELKVKNDCEVKRINQIMSELRTKTLPKRRTKPKPELLGLSHKKLQFPLSIPYIRCEYVT